MIRRIYTATVVGVAVAGLALAGTACGSQSVHGPPMSVGCVIKAHGVKSKILPQNSGFTCEDIKSILLLLPNAVGICFLKVARKAKGRCAGLTQSLRCPLK